MSDDRIGEHVLLAGVIFVGTAAMVQAGESCKAFRSGAKAQAAICADEAISELTNPDQYNSAVGLLDGIGEPAVASLPACAKGDQMADAGSGRGRVGPYGCAAGKARSSRERFGC